MNPQQIDPRLTNYVIQTIRENLEAQELLSTFVNPDWIMFLLSPQLTLEQCRVISRNHFSINNEDLAQLLNLQESRANNVGERRAVYFYVRSWRLSVEELTELVQEWNESSIHRHMVVRFEDLWIEADNNPVFIRYVGMCHAPTTPINRLEEDAARRTSGVLGAFLNFVRRNPTIEATGQVYSFAQVPQGIIDEPWISRMEQTIIAFFGIENLLNTSHGGFNSEYRPGLQYYNEYINLNQTFFIDWEAQQNPQLHRINNADGTLFQHWEPYLREVMTNNDFATLNGRYIANHAYLNMVLQQATPRRFFNDHVLVVMIGREVTRSSFTNLIPFLSMDSQAGFLTCDMLSRLYAWQYHMPENIQPIPNLLQQVFPFVNLYPWLGEILTDEEAVHQLNLYLNIVKPLVTITFSRTVLSCSMSSFTHLSGMPANANYIEFIGIPVVQNYDRYDWIQRNNVLDEEPSQNCMTITIPHIDPGVDKHTDRNPRYIRRVICLTHQVTLCILSIVQGVINQNPNFTRQQIIELAMQQCTPGLPGLDENLRILYTRLNEQKLVYVDHLNNALRNRATRTPLNPEDEEIRRARIGQNLVSRIERLGYAQGPPGSEERNMQAVQVYRRNIPDLHIHIPHNDGQRWLDWFVNLREGASLYSTARRAVEGPLRAIHPLYHLLVNNPPEGVNDNNWMNNENLVTEVLRRRGQHMYQARFRGMNDERIGVVMRDMALQRNVNRYRNILDGHICLISVTGRVILHWRNQAGELVRLALQLQVNRNSLRNLRDNYLRTREVRFVENGILFRLLADQQNNQDIPQDVRELLYSRRQISFSEDNHRLLQLWSTERSRLTGIPLEQLQNSIQLHQGRQMLTSRSHLINRINHFPIEEVDSIWLLQQYLNDEFPNGGRLSFVDENDPFVAFAIGTIFTLSIRNYLNQNHLNHARGRNQILGWCNDISSSNSHFLANIQMLRPFGVRQFRRVKPRTREVYEGSWTEVEFGGSDTRSAGDLTLEEFTEQVQRTKRRIPTLQIRQ